MGSNDVKCRQCLNFSPVASPLLSKEEAAQLLSRLAGHTSLMSNTLPVTVEVKKDEYELENHCNADTNTTSPTTSNADTKTTSPSTKSSKNEIKHSNGDYKIQKFRKLYTVDEAWRMGKAVKSESKGGRGRSSRAFTREYNFVYPSLLCNCCCWQGSCLIPIGDESYQNDCENTQRWWDTDFISGFAALIAHEAHVHGHLRGCQPRTQLIHCPFPRTFPDKQECKELDPSIDRIVSVLHSVDHYCVIEANLFHHVIKIYDGPRCSLKNWTNHIVNILKRCKLVDRKTDFKFTLEAGSMFHQVFKLAFSSEVEGVKAEMRESQFWFVKNDLKSQQSDTYNCGLIECMKVMELHDCSELIHIF